MKEKKEENEEEWIEIVVECPDCVKGRVVQWVERRSGKPPWTTLPCEICRGRYQTNVWQPKIESRPDCEVNAKHKCDGVFFLQTVGYVLTHEMKRILDIVKEDLSASDRWNEVGSGGH